MAKITPEFGRVPGAGEAEQYITPRVGTVPVSTPFEEVGRMCMSGI